ncbi:MAG: hypothetical protein HY862_10350 [Chloroflexi bacterium]|nr:hypothetical protein [Chloroflexota bacterium]
MVKKQSKRKVTLEDLKKAYKNCGIHYDGPRFQVEDHLEQLMWLFHNEGDYCDWCILDALATSNSPGLYRFFADLLNSPKGYAIAVAVDWLLRFNTGTSRSLLWKILPSKLHHKDEGVRKAAIKGIRGLNTKEARMLLWQALTTYTLDTPEETQKFRDMINEVLKSSPTKHRA